MTFNSHDNAADVTVIVPTYGDQDFWEPLAAKALASAFNQTQKPASILHSKAETLADARNDGAERAETEWLIFLDADDLLDERYVEAMFAVDGDIRRPATVDQHGGVPELIPRFPIGIRNFIVIGAMIRREQFLRVGGFKDYPILEDWELWLRMVVDGAIITDVPDAVYKVHFNPTGRNYNQELGNRIYKKIRRQYETKAHLLR